MNEYHVLRTKFFKNNGLPDSKTKLVRVFEQREEAERFVQKRQVEYRIVEIPEGTFSGRRRVR